MAKTSHSDVKLVRHKQLQVLRVAKTVYQNAAECSRILKEANLIKSLKYTGVPLIYDIDANIDSICIIEEYISGKSLTEYIHETGTLSITQIAILGVQICSVLEYLHNHVGIIHLDIKPANIIVRDEYIKKLADKEVCGISIIDFDSSRRIDEQCTKEYGTVGFAAPEQYVSSGTIDSDIYSIGILLLYMITGGHMQSITDDIQNVCQMYSASIGSIIKRCIRHNRNQRYKTITEVKNELVYISQKNNIDNNMNNSDNFICSNKEQKHIYVSGLACKIGTTHFCLCIASFLAKKNIDVVCIRHGDRRDYRDVGLLTKCSAYGTYQVYNIHIVPEYYQGVCCDLSQFTYCIHDMGIFKNQYVDNAINILIGIAGYRTCITDVMKKVNTNTILVINHIGGKEFYKYIKKINIKHRCFRFPCIYNWHKSNELFAELAESILHVENKKKRVTWYEKIFRACKTKGYTD